MNSTDAPIPIGSQLTREQAQQIVAQGNEAAVFALLQMAKLLAEFEAKLNPSEHPSTPSGQIPVYTKPPATKRRRRPGAQLGHAGSRRPPPVKIDHYVEHPSASACPDCGGPLNHCSEKRTRIIEDIPDIEPEVTEHTIPRDWCSACKKKVEPPISDALPGATLGNRVLVLSAWLHYALGNTLSQITEVFNFHLQLKLSEGGLIAMWQRLQEILFPWYEQIQREALQSAVLHADETGWRVEGHTEWLWCFCTTDSTYYMIDRSRGSPALAKFFIDEFAGVLVSDFWGAYNSVCCALRQMCLVHLLRELEQTEKYKSPGEHWPAFSKKLHRLLGDAIRLRKNWDQYSDQSYASRRDRLVVRLQELIDTDWQNQHANRLVKRLRRHQSDILTFLDQADVPFENNHAERSIRPAVILRKNSYGNRSSQGADCQAVLMSIFRTLKQRGHDPIRVIVSALATYLTTQQLPPLPQKITSDR